MDMIISLTRRVHDHVALPMPFAMLELHAGEERLIGRCALTHAALANATAGGVRVSLDGQVVCCLNEHIPQATVCIIASASGILRCEGAAGASVHVFGRGSNRSAAPNGAAERDARAAARNNSSTSVSTLEHQHRSPAAAKQAADLPHSGSSSQGKKTRTPRLTFNPEVLVAEYVPKVCAPSKPCSVLFSMC